MDAANNSSALNTNIFLIGFMGSGKSHWGKIWAERNQLSFIDLDELIEKDAGKSIAAIFESKGEDYFRLLESEALRKLEGFQNTIIACGGGTPCFYNNIDWMNQHGITIYIESTPVQILERVFAEKEKRPLLKKLNEAELLFFIEQKLKERQPHYSKATITVQSVSLHEEVLPELTSSIKS